MLFYRFRRIGSSSSQRWRSAYHCMTLLAGCCKRAASFGLVIGLASAAILFLGSATLQVFAPVQTMVLDPATVRFEEGFAYVAPVPLRVRWPCVIKSDTSGPLDSRLVVVEDGRPLGPGHSAHSSIRTEGHGRYSHWSDHVWFSTSDRSDPRTNGRTYAVSAKPDVSPALAMAAAAIALITSIVYWTSLGSLLPNVVPKLVAWSLSLLLVVCVLLARGVLGHVVLGADEPKDAALVQSLVWHAAVGVLITFVQLAIGAGALRLCLRRTQMTLATAVVFGYPISLLLLAIGAAASLVLSWGREIAALVGLLLLASLRRDLPLPAEWSRVAALALALVLPSAAFGIWLALLWHGPTATLPGTPSGDLIYYSTLVSTLQADPWPPRNWGNEGEIFAPFNMLWPAIGAALASPLGLEPFAFLTASGGTAFMLSTTLMLLAYLRSRANRVSALACAALILAFLSAGRYPFWIVESVPQIHALGLTIAIWHWVTEGWRIRFGSLAAVFLALAGSLLTKVVTAATLVPLALGALVPRLRHTSVRARMGIVVAAVLAAAYGLVMVMTFAPRLLALGGVGPESYMQIYRYEASSWSATPYVLRDLGTIILAFAAVRIAPRWAAIPIVIGLGSGFLAPFTMRGAHVAAVVLVALCAFDYGERLARNQWLPLFGFLLCLPAMVMTDPSGGLSGFVWVICMGLAVATVLTAARHLDSGIPAASTPLWCGKPYYLIGLAAALCMFLIAVVRGYVGLGSNFIADPDGKLQPQIYNLWHTVRIVVPPDALVFTDQTGRGPGLLEGWNTYAFHGQRQLYISTWVQSAELRTDFLKRLTKLSWNDRVLNGEAAPTDVPLQRKYGAYYAVVRHGQAVRMTGWAPVCFVDDFAILRWKAVGHQ